jgi:hypothetical protein
MNSPPTEQNRGPDDPGSTNTQMNQPAAILSRLSDEKAIGRGRAHSGWRAVLVRRRATRELDELLGELYPDDGRDQLVRPAGLAGHGAAAAYLHLRDVGLLSELVEHVLAEGVGCRCSNCRPARLAVAA